MFVVYICFLLFDFWIVRIRQPISFSVSVQWEVCLESNCMMRATQTRFKGC